MLPRILCYWVLCYQGSTVYRNPWQCFEGYFHIIKTERWNTIKDLGCTKSKRYDVHKMVNMSNDPCLSELFCSFLYFYKKNLRNSTLQLLFIFGIPMNSFFLWLFNCFIKYFSYQYVLILSYKAGLKNRHKVVPK